VQRVIAIGVILSVPALCAPSLARARGTIWPRPWLLVAATVCSIPLSAPWLSIGVASPLTIWLIAIAGGIGALRAVEWLAHPRYADDRLRVLLALTVWLALEVGDAGIRLPEFRQRIGAVARRFGAGLASGAGGLAMTALGQKLSVANRGLVFD
jgi:hypothetical protein